MVSHLHNATLLQNGIIRMAASPVQSEVVVRTLAPRTLELQKHVQWGLLLCQHIALPIHHTKQIQQHFGRMASRRSGQSVAQSQAEPETAQDHADRRMAPHQQQVL